MRRALIWLICAVIALMSVLALLLLGSSGEPHLAAALSGAVYRLQPVAIVLIGATVTLKRPGHPIGLLLLGVAAVLASEGFTRSYALYGLGNDSPPLPGAIWAAWLQEWMWLPSFSFLFAILLLFPDGRLVSPRWTAVAWVAVVYAPLIAPLAAFHPGPLIDFPMVDNPLGWAPMGPVVERVFPMPMLLVMQGLLLSAGASVVVRFRRSQGVERQQLKWFAYAICVIVVSFVVSINQALGSWGDLLNNLCLMGLPVSMGIAILRYRLYEIDLIIRRTLVYGGLTTLLALLYWACVVVLQQVLQPLTQGSDLAIVGSTLAVAALFQPLRRRIQEAVDRRFYRHRYDAARTLDDFSSRLREQIDLDSLRSELVAVVGRTVQPAHVSLWLRPQTK
jgi:hypothetical protein